MYRLTIHVEEAQFAVSFGVTDLFLMTNYVLFGLRYIIHIPC